MLGLALLDRGRLLASVANGGLERALHAGHRSAAVEVARIRQRIVAVTVAVAVVFRRGDMRFSSISTVTIVGMMHRRAILGGGRVGGVAASSVTTGITITKEGIVVIIQG